MINYKLMTDKVMKERDVQIVMELLEDRGISAQFEGYEHIKIGTPIRSL